MVLARWNGAVLDEDGNALSGASVEVRRETVGAPLASLFSDRDGLTPMGNPFTAQETGNAYFHAAGGAYRVTVTHGAFSRTWRYVALGLVGESDGLAAGTPYTLDAATADADPGVGTLRFNNASPASATQIFIDNLDAAGADVSTWLDSFGAGGVSANRGLITIQSSDGSDLFIATVTGSVTDGTGYRKLTVTPLVTSGTFEDGQAVFIQFAPGASDGVDGVAAGYPFNFDSATAMADPGAGDFRLNNATLSSVTAAAIDDTSAASGNPDVSAAVLSWDDSTSSVRGYLLIKKASAPQNFALYSITGASTDNTGWTQLALTYVTHAGSFTDADLCSLEFTRTGDQGTVVGKQTIWVPAGAMQPRATNGAAIGTLDTGNQDITIPVLDFDQTTGEFAHFNLAMPKSWDEGTVTFQPYWTSDAGSAAQTVRWTLGGVSLSNDDVLNTAVGTAQNSDDALIATGDLHIGPESSSITIGGTPAEGDLVIFQLGRDVANDNLAADARLIGIKVFITLNANTDA